MFPIRTTNAIYVYGNSISYKTYSPNHFSELLNLQIIIAERLSTRHIIVTLFLLNVYIYICVSRLGVLTPKTTHRTGWTANRNHMCIVY